MQIRITSSVVTSQGIAHRGVTVDLPDSEAVALVRMGRAVPCESAPPAPEHRESTPPVVRRGRKKAEVASEVASEVADDVAD
jgi:hypothetical protein